MSSPISRRRRASSLSDRALHRTLAAIGFLLAPLWIGAAGAANAASFGPPLLDITHQCSLNSRRNVTAMSECIVAESEARAEILQKWHKVPDASADRCVKLGRKNQKYPYTAIAKCITAEAAPPAVAPPAATSVKPAPTTGRPAAAKPARAAPSRP